MQFYFVATKNSYSARISAHPNTTYHTHTCRAYMRVLRLSRTNTITASHTAREAANLPGKCMQIKQNTHARALVSQHKGFWHTILHGFNVIASVHTCVMAHTCVCSRIRIASS